MPDIAEKNWIEEDERNVNAAPRGFPPGMPAYIDTAGRMVMGAVKRFWRRINPYYLTAGSADNYTVTPDLKVTKLNLYEVINVRIHQTNTTTSPTLKFSSTPAYPIMRYTTSGKVALSAGDLVAGDSSSIWWDGTTYILSGGGSAADAALARTALQPTPQSFTALQQAQIQTNIGILSATQTLLDTVSDGRGGPYQLTNPAPATNGYLAVSVYLDGVFQPRDNVSYQIINGGTQIQFTGSDSGFRIIVVSALGAGISAPSPVAAFGAAYLEWFNTLPLTLPATPGLPWNDGGTLAIS